MSTCGALPVRLGPCEQRSPAPRRVQAGAGLPWAAGSVSVLPGKRSPWSSRGPSARSCSVSTCEGRPGCAAAVSAVFVSALRTGCALSGPGPWPPAARLPPGARGGALGAGLGGAVPHEAVLSAGGWEALLWPGRGPRGAGPQLEDWDRVL